MLSAVVLVEDVLGKGEVSGNVSVVPSLREAVVVAGVVVVVGSWQLALVT
jgi:hypothetical protein